MIYLYMYINMACESCGPLECEFVLYHTPTTSHETMDQHPDISVPSVESASFFLSLAQNRHKTNSNPLSRCARRIRSLFSALVPKVNCQGLCICVHLHKERLCKPKKMCELHMRHTNIIFILITLNHHRLISCRHCFQYDELLVQSVSLTSDSVVA